MQYLEAAKQALQLGHAGYRYLSRGKSNNPRCRIETEFMASVTLTSGQAGLFLSDTLVLSQDLAELGDIYRFYKFNRVWIELPAPNWTTAAFLAVSFVPSAQSNVSSFANTEARRVLLMSANQTTSGRLEVGKSMIAGMLPWFLTNATATDTNLEVQGTFLFQSQVTSTETIYFKIHVEGEYKDLLDPATVTANLKKRFHRLGDKSKSHPSGSQEDGEDKGTRPLSSAEKGTGGRRCLATPRRVISSEGHTPRIVTEVEAEVTEERRICHCSACNDEIP